MRRSNAPTLQDVADGAGVSIMMASVVINGAQSSTRVSAVTRERILASAATLGYRRNAVAHGLSRQRMDTIGVTAAIDGGEVNLYLLEVLNGILEGAAERGQNTTIFSLSSWSRESDRLPGFCDGRVDGMILIAPHLHAPERLSHHTPFVTIHGNETHPATTNLDTDNEGGAYSATRHLVDLGHRRIVHFPGEVEVLGVQMRIAGFRRALLEANISEKDGDIVPGNFSVWSGRSRAQAMVLETPAEELPTAIFCGSDAIAYGCMEVLAANGIRVPDEISIVGFDDTLLTRMTRPPLTTVRQPFRQMGKCAVESLLSLVDGDPPAQVNATSELGRTRIFPAELVVRDSTGPPRST